MQAVSVVIGVGQNAPVLPSKVHMQLCNMVAIHPLPCAAYGSFKIFKISATEFGTMSIPR